MTSTPKKQDLPTIKEQRSLLRGINLRTNANNISPTSFLARKTYMISAFQSGAFLKNPEAKGQPPANPMSDPAAMDGMMGMMKGQMAMIIPQTLIMGWINAFFSGFVVLRMPFPLTPRFKQMLQSGVATRDLDVRWVSSISLYFICLFGLQSVFVYLLGSDNGKLSTDTRLHSCDGVLTVSQLRVRSPSKWDRWDLDRGQTCLDQVLIHSNSSQGRLRTLRFWRIITSLMGLRIDFYRASINKDATFM
jgi:hypothetical protein